MARSPLLLLLLLLTCKNETGSFSLRASIQNCNRDVVFCNLHVQLVTCSFSDRCLVSLSRRTASISHCLLLSIDRISASHLASTCLSSSSHSPCAVTPNRVRRYYNNILKLHTTPGKRRWSIRPPLPFRRPISCRSSSDIYIYIGIVYLRPSKSRTQHYNRYARGDVSDVLGVSTCSRVRLKIANYVNNI